MRRRFHGGSLPYGWKLSNTGRLIKDKEEQSVIKLAKKLRANGHIFWKISKILSDNGYISRLGKPFIPGQLKRMIEEKK